MFLKDGCYEWPRRHLIIFRLSLKFLCGGFFGECLTKSVGVVIFENLRLKTVGIMQNKLTDLNNHLFAQIERLSDENTTGENLAEELERSKAVATISREIISVGKLAFEAEKEFGVKGKAPRMLGVEEGETNG